MESNAPFSADPFLLSRLLRPCNLICSKESLHLRISHFPEQRVIFAFTGQCFRSHFFQICWKEGMEKWRKIDEVLEGIQSRKYSIIYLVSYSLICLLLIRSSFYGLFDYSSKKILRRAANLASWLKGHLCCRTALV